MKNNIDKKHLFEQIIKLRDSVNNLINENYPVSPGTLYRDMNDELKNILNSVVRNYQISPDEAASVIAEYFTSKQWNS